MNNAICGEIREIAREDALEVPRINAEYKMHKAERPLIGYENW